MNSNEKIFQKPNEGQIIIVDDQFASLQSIILKFQDIGLQNKIETFNNGKQVVSYLEKFLATLKAQAN